MSTDISIPPNKLFLNEEDKTEEALNSFIPIESCIYSSKKLGNSKNNDFIECDCYEDKDPQIHINHACDEDSDCINRLTLIECVNNLCYSCGNDCQNQRFQKKQYSNVSIFKTKLKGYGVRANENIENGQFIYEYIGEVIDEIQFRERMIDYDLKKFKHFYFMMLQNGQFIDATIKGSLARFCNHSCSPNAYVNKWEVAGKLRMGIFAKRKILKGEEITFDYNVDRYGATAQKCYCDEPNCIGFLGGKTQTEAASLLPQSYAEALGIRPSIEKQWIKEMKRNGQKIEKAKNNDNNINVDFVDSLDILPCETPDDVRKVMSILLQVDSTYMATKLFHRLFNITNENEILLHQVIKLHGYICFSKLLDLFQDDSNTIEEILEFLMRLPKSTKNGIVSSQIDKKISNLSEEIPHLKDQCDLLIEKWNQYETYNRIAKRDITNDLNGNGNGSSSNLSRLMDMRRVRLPLGWEIIFENGRRLFFNAEREIKLTEPPTEEQLRLDDHAKDKDVNDNQNGRHRHQNRNRDNHHRPSRYNNNEDNLESHWNHDKNKIDSNMMLSSKKRRRMERQLELSKARAYANKKRREELEKKIKGQTSSSTLNSPMENNSDNNNSSGKDDLNLNKSNSLNHSHNNAQTPSPTPADHPSGVETNKTEILKIIEHANKIKELEREKELKLKRENEMKRKKKSISESNEHKWDNFFASFVPNLVRKNTGDVELSRDHIKECSRDIVKTLTSKELKRDDPKPPPEEATKEKKYKVNKFVKIYMEKFITKYKEKHSRAQSRSRSDLHHHTGKKTSS
ncbi:histone methyltransferase SET2 NDAI_0B00260 [Naumovozyma dairenensis CBS 421]|uniref:Histone-lysine N-methyltransferase, H3 lysine-36 specific n=1 Tax=Naumovozyma dairenensis (strain ATCC 10597 / BCRC 20456 / CBS 421 / NBRC 0211 / NRRL Y-12639) TaxID=1071378 RepID=G0W5J9_NAUDC|nr:hypothetical protein NDAI_0B00260 [Naumovozyma dairenensis CBS 421]CCD23060.1 hypothetical protein NDAI_0B00260 [Naumovozyma dairenensis CBS 421]